MASQDPPSKGMEVRAHPHTEKLTVRARVMTRFRVQGEARRGLTFRFVGRRPKPGEMPIAQWRAGSGITVATDGAHETLRAAGTRACIYAHLPPG
jgi:hypothetical protein